MSTPPINGVTVCVDYSDYLSLTLQYNRHHFDKFAVVTASSDRATKELAKKHNCIVVSTQAMYADDAHFNKWSAAAQGFDAMSIPEVQSTKSGYWYVYIDADILLPQRIEWNALEQGNLYVPHRRQITQLCDILPNEHYWPTNSFDGEAINRASYCQIWHSHDKHVPDSDWQDADIVHAGGKNSLFQSWWDRRISPFDVLHLSTPRMDWCGRISRYTNGELNIVGPSRYKTLKKFIQSPEPLDEN